MTTSEYLHRMKATDFAVCGRLSGERGNPPADLAALRSMTVERRREIYYAALHRITSEREDHAFEAELKSEAESQLYCYLCGIVRDGPDGLEG